MLSNCPAGLAMCYQCPLGLQLSSGFHKALRGWDPTLSDLRQFDEQLASSMDAILSASPSTLADMDLEYAGNYSGKLIHVQSCLSHCKTQAVFVRNISNMSIVQPASLWARACLSHALSV